ncbi:hypothetical protein GH714_028508 [Hevea brasiliensis]|uniref:Uncharacterized protein n=1 Tax=Hevea brasiliensis TaxID=3981 RepID=A0A6A6LKX8_HEVBR|nr:hypothetical protein GH714_028508 [Hevea brasiliensis]
MEDSREPLLSPRDDENQNHPRDKDQDQRYSLPRSTTNTSSFVPDADDILLSTASVISLENSTGSPRNFGTWPALPSSPPFVSTPSAPSLKSLQAKLEPSNSPPSPLRTLSSPVFPSAPCLEWEVRLKRYVGKHLEQGNWICLESICKDHGSFLALHPFFFLPIYLRSSTFEVDWANSSHIKSSRDILHLDDTSVIRLCFKLPHGKILAGSKQDHGYGLDRCCSFGLTRIFQLVIDAEVGMGIGWSRNSIKCFLVVD